LSFILYVKALVCKRWGLAFIVLSTIFDLAISFCKNWSDIFFVLIPFIFVNIFRAVLREDQRGLIDWYFNYRWYAIMMFSIASLEKNWLGATLKSL